MRLIIPVARPADLIAQGYTTIEVWRSDDEANSYQELTASQAAPATLLSTPASSTFDMGTSPVLTLKVDGGPATGVPFSGFANRYWTPAQVVAAINDVFPNLAQVSGSSVLLTSSTSGLVSSLEVTYGVSCLGWVTGDKSQGLAARLPITAEQIYTLIDILGYSFSRYSWRYSKDGSNPISPFMVVVPTPAPLPSTLISYATAQFISFDGSPVQRRVIIGQEGKRPQSMGGYTVSDQSQIYQSDSGGFLMIPLMQGTSLRVAIEGTALVRSIIVPTVPVFDLLQALGGAADPFEVQTTPPLITRRSL